MSSLATTTAKAHILKLGVYFPEAGGWQAEALLEGGDVPSGKVTITTGDLTLNGTVLRAGFDFPDRPNAVVVGGIGWQSKVDKPISFQSDAGVRLSTVLTTIARAAGETIEQPKDVSLGNYYECVASRSGEPVRWSDVLADLVRAGYVAPWRVDPDGVTRFGPRASQEVSGRATVIRQDAAAGLTVYGVDSPAEFLPGNTVAGKVIGQTRIRETSGKLEVDVYAKDPTAPPTIRELLYRMLGGMFDDMVRTYVVHTVHADGRLDLSPPEDSPHLPEMKNVEQWVLGGVLYIPSPGDEVIVTFRDWKKTRPVVCGFKLSGGPFAGLARLGDSVTVMLPPANFSGTISGSPASGMVVWSPGQTMGTITTSSAKSKGGP